MGFPKKHTYKDGSPGYRRQKEGVTLTFLKKQLRNGDARRDVLQERGLLAKRR